MTKTMTRTTFGARAIAFAIAALLFLPAFSHAAEADTAETEATVTFTAGQLELISAPVLDFGSHDIAGTTQSYQATTVDGQIQISDLRGSAAGWELTASLTAFNRGSVGTNSLTLQGAYITVTDQSIAAQSGTAASAPTAPDSAVLTAGGASTRMLQAESGTGLGIWNSTWSSAGTSLTVLPGTAQTGTSYAVINWSLQDTP